MERQEEYKMNQKEEIIRNEAVRNMDCLQSCIYYISKNIYLTYMPMLTCWGFYYEQGKRCIGDGIVSPDGMLVNKFLMKYLDTHVEFYQRTYEQDSVVIQEALGKRKIVIGIDAYQCSWNIAYQKKHIPHFLVLDARKGDRFFFYDPYISNKQYEMDSGQLQNCYYNVRIFQEDGVDKNPNITLHEVYRLLLSGYSDTYSSGIAEAFKIFAQSLLYAEDFSMLYETGDVRLCSFIQNLRTLYGVRLSISYILLYMEKNIKSFGINHFHMDFFQMAEMLQMINMQMMKLNLMGKMIPQKQQEVAEMLRKLGELEETTYFKILELQSF